MNQIDQEMLLIKALDPDARLLLSDYTGKWYVLARIEVSDGAVLGGITEHRANPALAVSAFLEYLKAVKWPAEFIVTHSSSETDRREWRWNGAGWVDVTRPEIKAKR